MEISILKKSYNQSQILIGILIIWYIVGISALCLQVHPDFILLTPLNLLLSVLIVWYNHPKWSKSIIFMLLTCYLVGFFVEMIGTQTGLLFGAYTYGQTLGPKIAETPLFMGVNWAMLVYLVATMSNHYFPKAAILTKSMIGATLMTFLDLFIEPVALKLDFWTWTDQGINSFLVAPLKNYLVWWGLSFLLIYSFHTFIPTFKNKVAEALYWILLIFFIVINFLAI